jgi:hypothetical protein
VEPPVPTVKETLPKAVAREMMDELNKADKPVMVEQVKPVPVTGKNGGMVETVIKNIPRTWTVFTGQWWIDKAAPGVLVCAALAFSINYFVGALKEYQNNQVEGQKQMIALMMKIEDQRTDELKSFHGELLKNQVSQTVELGRLARIVEKMEAKLSKDEQ